MKMRLASLSPCSARWPAAPAAAAEKLTVMLDWFVNPDHAPLFVAQQKGYFKDAGLEVD